MSVCPQFLCLVGMPGSDPSFKTITEQRGTNMRKILANAHLSLAGVMQGPGGAQEDPSDGFDLGGVHLAVFGR